MRRKPAQEEPLWRDEFSIQSATEKYVARRQFAKFLVLTSLGMFIGNLWILVRSWFLSKPSFAPQRVSGLNEIAVGDVKLFSYPTAEDPCIMIRTGPQQFVAYSQKCTHLSSLFTSPGNTTAWNAPATKDTSLWKTVPSYKGLHCVPFPGSSFNATETTLLRPRFKYDAARRTDRD